MQNALNTVVFIINIYFLGYWFHTYENLPIRTFAKYTDQNLEKNHSQKANKGGLVYFGLIWFGGVYMCLGFFLTGPQFLNWQEKTESCFHSQRKRNCLSSRHKRAQWSVRHIPITARTMPPPESLIFRDSATPSSTQVVLVAFELKKCIPVLW